MTIGSVLWPGTYCLPAARIAVVHVSLTQTCGLCGLLLQYSPGAYVLRNEQHGGTMDGWFLHKATQCASCGNQIQLIRVFPCKDDAYKITREMDEQCRKKGCINPDLIFAQLNPYVDTRLELLVSRI